MGRLRIIIDGYGFTPQTETIARAAVARLKQDGASLSWATLQHGDEDPVDLRDTPASEPPAAGRPEGEGVQAP